MKIKPITDPSFKKYGRIVDEINFGNLIQKLNDCTQVPEGVAYEPSVEALESIPEFDEIRDKLYGEMPIQIGYCNGHNVKLNAVEYHRDCEINVAATDAILLLGLLQDVNDDYTYETAKMEAFLLPKGCAVLIHATTLHYAPARQNMEAFRVGIILPKNTNYPLSKKHEGREDKLITAVNKWLIGHEEGGLDDGAFIGLLGENLNVDAMEG